MMNQFQRTFFLINRKFSIFESALIHRRTHTRQLTSGHTQLPCRGVANAGSFGYLSGNTKSERIETATAHTAERCTQAKETAQQ